MNTNEQVIEVLRGFADGSIQPYDPRCGLCWNLANAIEGLTLCETVRMINDRSSNWPKNSGEYNYPIPATYKGITESREQYLMRNNLWVGKQGELRRQLCRFLVKELKRESYKWRADRSGQSRPPCGAGLRA